MRSLCNAAPLIPARGLTARRPNSGVSVLRRMRLAHVVTPVAAMVGSCGDWFWHFGNLVASVSDWLNY